MADLKDELNKYASRLIYFSKTRTKQIVYAYVEGDDDVSFWQYALDTFGNTTKYSFLVRTNRMAVAANNQGSNSGNNSNGKDVLMGMQGLGANRIICVDADYDLVIPNYSAYSQRIRTEPYILNTYYYSVENILASPEFRQTLTSSLELTNDSTQYVALLEHLSLICRNLVTLTMSLPKYQGWTTMINQGVTSINFSKSDADNAATIHTMFQTEFTQHAARVTAEDQALISFGIPISETWKCIQGHCLANIVVLPMLLKKVKASISKKTSEFANNFLGDPVQKAKEIETYHKSLQQGYSAYPTLQSAVEKAFYTNRPAKPWIPLQIEQKIRLLFQ